MRRIFSDLLRNDSQCADRAYGTYGLKRLRVHRVNRLKSLKRAFFRKRANGAYRSYAVGKIDLQC